MAAALPPVPRLALELRLGNDGAPPDLHQQLNAGAADPVTLERYLSATPAGPLAMPGLRRFLRDWADHASGLQANLSTLYLEWDQQAPGSAPGSTPAAPGLFLPVERPGDSADQRAVRRRAAAQHAERLRPGLGQDVGAALERLYGRVPVGVTVSFVGFMLGRDGGFRVNLRGVRRADLARVLAAIDWPGDASAAARAFERLVDLSDRVVVALDFAPMLQAGIGFEIVLDSRSGADPRWARLLDHFSDQGLCTAEQSQALVAFPADFYPERGDFAWPASWLVAAVLSPPGCLPWVERRISHLKLSLRPNGQATAKAYVSAEHHWSRQAAPPAAAGFEAEPRGDALMEAARARAVGFLAGAIGQDDLWRDFRMPGASDEWVTGFVGWALAGEEDERARAAVARAVAALLARQRPDGGWGYNRICGSDADSTAWALRLLKAAGHGGPAAMEAETFLRSHFLPDGGVATYAQRAIVHYDDQPWHGPSQGWRSGHLCVAANAAGALPGLLEPFLRARQSDDGSWPAYWWRTDTFSTALAVDALDEGRAGGPGEIGAEACRRAIGWARGQSPERMTTFERAWLAFILAHGVEEDREAAALILTGLAREQGTDGGWDAGAELLLPHPSELTRKAGSAVYLDVRRLFTTASVLASINAAARRLVP
ncbi:MAG: prenyltransferase/squalene oxidase repeat-containing protein [Allosphingosinicella sp.]